MDAINDVMPASSAGSQDAEPPVPDSAGNTDVDEGTIGDRPVRNLRAEFDRKLGRIENQLAELVSAVSSSRQTPTHVARKAEPAEPSDEELARAATLGDTTALVMLNQRIAARESAAAGAVTRKEQNLRAMMSAIVGKYPGLLDPSNALRAKSLQAKAMLVNGGYDAGALETDLEAIKLAIVDNPDLAQQAMGKPSTATVAADPATAARNTPVMDVGGNAPRRTPATSTPSVTVSKEEKAIAQRMGVKDPAKASANFEKRQRDGRSRLGPSIISSVKES